MESIEVGYSHLADGYYHKYIVYTNNAGQVSYARGGPGGEGSLIGDWIGWSGADFGFIQTEHGVYDSTTIDWDAEGDDPRELIASGTDLSGTWTSIIQAMDAIEAEQHTYDVLTSNSNTTVDTALVRAGLPQPTRDDLFDLGDHWAPASGATLDVVANTYVAYSGNVGQLVQAVAGASPGIHYLTTGATYFGALAGTSVFYNLAIGTANFNTGILLTSGDGTPPLSNTSSSYGENVNGAGLPALTSIVTAVFPQSPQTWDASALTFQVEISDASITTISFDVLFGSDEYPEYSNSYVDIGAVIVNGQNYAFFNGNSSQPLSVLNQNLSSFITNSSLPIEYDGMSQPLIVTAPVQLGVNTITLAVADTGDHILDSGLFVSSMRGTEFASGGVLIEVSPGTNDNGNDTLNGSSASEHFIAGAGNDTVDGGGGNDLIELGSGNDTANGGDGNDQIVGGSGDDTVNGNAGDDILIAANGQGNDYYDGGADNDTLSFQSATQNVYVAMSGGAGSVSMPQTGLDQYVNIENVSGGSGNDTLIGDAAGNRLAGGAGYDALYGGGGNDNLSGGALEDVLVGDAGSDTLNGGDGGDVLSELYDPVNSGNDTFDGGNGIDIMYSAAGDDIVTGGADAANNYANLGDGADTYTGSSGTDVVQGGTGNDIITGNDGDDSLYGEADSDTIYGGNGIDLLSGSTGNDILDGGAGNDLLIGDEGSDRLLGGGGIDVLYGFANDDILNGGTGGDVDALYGGGGNDSFQVGGSGYGIDYVYDFVGGAGTSDRLLVATGATITSQGASSGNYIISFSNGSQVRVVGVTNVLGEDIVLNGF